MVTHRDPHYAGYRHPAEVISDAVWLYFRFLLSLRMVEEMLAARGVFGAICDDPAVEPEIRPGVA
jgi:transposase-like protein